MKKKYETPSVMQVAMTCAAAIFAGSGVTGKTTDGDLGFSGTENEEHDMYVRQRHHSEWDDEDDI